MQDTNPDPRPAREIPPVVEATPPPRKFSRHVRQLFVFLVVLVAITNLSSVMLLESVVRDEAHRVREKLRNALEQLELVWVQSPSDQRHAINIDSLAITNGVGRLSFAVRADLGHGTPRWAAQIAGDTTFAVAGQEMMEKAPVFPESGEAASGIYWEFRSSADIWAGHNVIASAGMPAPRLGEMQNQLKREVWIRVMVFAAFGVFALLFYRLVLLPFRDMRRRAAALMQSDVLPADLAALQDDPEYVMSTFDVLVHELLKRADVLKQRAVSSERRARDLERFNAFMLSSLSTGVVILNRQGRILEMNPSGERILGVRGIDPDGLSCIDAGMPPEMIALIEEGLRDGYTYSRRELRVDRSDGTPPRYLGVNTSLILDDHDDVIGLSVLLSDITEIKQLYNELEENQRLADLGEMSAGLAHQLRNSTAAILGYGKLLIGTISRDTTEREWAQAIVAETRETEVMLTKFLDFARPLSADRVVTNLPDVVEESIQTMQRLADENGIKLMQSLSTDTPALQVMGDALLLKQVLVNLIQNAIEAIEVSGTVDITIGSVPRRDEVRATARVTVADTGAGICDDDVTRIFQPFHTSKEQGTGLGLPLAKKIAVLHGGNLTLESTTARGSTFVLTLPLADTETEPSPNLSWKPAVNGTAAARTHS